jgi:hypothetical protein
MPYAYQVILGFQPAPRLPWFRTVCGFYPSPLLTFKDFLTAMDEWEAILRVGFLQGVEYKRYVQGSGFDPTPVAIEFNHIKKLFDRPTAGITHSLNRLERAIQAAQNEVGQLDFDIQNEDGLLASSVQNVVGASDLNVQSGNGHLSVGRDRQGSDEDGRLTLAGKNDLKIWRVIK